jgi:NAD(P)-dependent dehydrogenase (short-subunit alcohol dehydrogenase family)
VAPSGQPVVVVTGAAGGIGRALCLRFGRAGNRIGALDRDTAGIERLTGDLEAAGIETFPQLCDVTDPESCNGAIASVEERFGGVDILINNAGITHRSPFIETDPSVYRRVMDVNFFGALHCTKAAIDTLLERRGLVVVIASVAGFSPLPERTGYCASKYALRGFFDTLRCELEDRGVRVLVVCPGFTATEIERNALDGQGGPAKHPQSRVGRLAAPDSVADAVYRGAQSGRRMLVLSGVGRTAYLLTRIAPSLHKRVVSRLFRGGVKSAP